MKITPLMSSGRDLIETARRAQSQRASLTLREQRRRRISVEISGHMQASFRIEGTPATRAEVDAMISRYGVFAEPAAY